MGRISDLIRIGPISGFRLRTKLLLLALTTLALPWAGCQYAREMETVLRESEQQSLLAVTTTIAGSLKGRQELLFRADSLPAVANANARDITPVVLSGAPLIDGRADEWDTDSRNLIRVAWPRRRRPAAARPQRMNAGCISRLLVRDDKVVFDASMLRPLDSESIGDRIWLAFDDKRGGQQQLFFASTGAGAIARPAHRNPRIWPRGSGGRAAHRIGVAAFARRLRARNRHSAVAGWPAHRRAHRRSRPSRRDARRATARSTSPTCAPPGRLIAASPDLSDHLRQFAQPGVELTVASSTGAILTRLDAPALPGDYTRMRGFLPRMYRLFLDGDAVPRRVSQAERQRAAESLTTRVAARQARDRAVRRPVREQRHRRRRCAYLLGRRQTRIRRHPARADRRSLAHACATARSPGC